MARVGRSEENVSDEANAPSGGLPERLSPSGFGKRRPGIPGDSLLNSASLGCGETNKLPRALIIIPDIVLTARAMVRTADPTDRGLAVGSATRTDDSRPE